MGTTLGVDWGRARIGVAVSDELGLLAHPLTTLAVSRLDEQAEGLARLAETRGAETIVLGLPLNMDGTEGPSAAAVRRLAEALRARGARPVVLWDERLTSFEAQARLAGRGPRRKKGRQDMAAACLILQSYLDAKKSSRTPPRSPQEGG